MCCRFHMDPQTLKAYHMLLHSVSYLRMLTVWINGRVSISSLNWWGCALTGSQWREAQNLWKRIVNRHIFFSLDGIGWLWTVNETWRYLSTWKGMRDKTLKGRSRTSRALKSLAFIMVSCLCEEFSEFLVLCRKIDVYLMEFSFSCLILKNFKISTWTYRLDSKRSQVIELRLKPQETLEFQWWLQYWRVWTQLNGRQTGGFGDDGKGSTANQRRDTRSWAFTQAFGSWCKSFSFRACSSKDTFMECLHLLTKFYSEMQKQMMAYMAQRQISLMDA